MRFAMIHSLRRREPVILNDCASLASIELHDRNDYIVRAHVFADKAPPRYAPRRRVLSAWVGLLRGTLTTWRRRYLTRRHLASLDERGLADIGIDQAVRDREVARKFWQP
jgi:uncharacterized protein YjiS (DUF1127 family)